MLPVPAHAQVYSVEEGGAVKMLCSNVVLGNDLPVALQGGAVLSVAFLKKAPPGAGWFFFGATLTGVFLFPSCALCTQASSCAVSRLSTRAV